MAKTEDMRGLRNFIKEIRACGNKDEEEKRVEKELANIASHYQLPRLRRYDQKKYTWKLLYIYMLGYDVDFGHRQAADLCSAEVFSEKQVGYVACSVLLNENHEFLRLIVNSIQKDIDSRNEAYQSLALSFVGSVGGAEMAESLTDNVIKVLTGGTARTVIKKKAALALLRLLRKTRGEADFLPADSWGIKLAQLLEEKDLGLRLCVVNLLIGIVFRSYVGYENCVPGVVSILKMLVTNSKDVPPEYKYYGVPSPWLQVKALRALQYFPLPTDSITLSNLKEILSSIMLQASAKTDTNGEQGKTSSRKNVNLNNAKNAILFEAISYCLGSEIDNELLMKGVHILGDFLTGNEPNIKYLALENMARLAVVPDLFEAIKEKQGVVLASLKDHDVSIRKRALDLLYKICDASNAHQIVDELLATLAVADQTMKDQLVLKIAILAEKFASSVEWYVDVLLRLMRLGGNCISHEIWQRAIQVITNHESMQLYAVNQCIEALQTDAVSDALLSISGFVLGEFGELSEQPPQDLFTLLYDKFRMASDLNKGMLITTFFKLLLLAPMNPKLNEDVGRILRQYSTHQDTEIQQRSVEYQVLMENLQQASQLGLFTAMPKWPQQESMLIKKLAQQDAENAEQYDSYEGGENGDIGEGGQKLPIPSIHQRQVSDILKFDTIELPVENGMEGAVQAIPKQGQQYTMDDLFGGPPTPQATQQQMADPFAPSPGNAFADPFAPVPTQPAPVAAPTPLQVEMVKDLEKCFADLTFKDSGVLYEDVNLQIGQKAVYAGNIGQIQLFLGNKQATISLTSVMMKLRGEIAGLQVQIDESQVPSVLEPQVQKIAPLRAECQMPFVGTPTMLIGYTLENQFMEKEIALPILPSKFLNSFKIMDKQEFYNQWRQAAESNKAGEIVDMARPVAIQSVVDTLEGIGFSAKDRDLDPNVNNDAGAGYFMYQGGQMFCMVRVEVTPERQKLKVTVVTPNPQLSQALKDQIVQRIKSQQ